MAADRAWIDEVRAALAAAGDPARAAGQQRYMKSTMPYHGVTTPELRRLLRPRLLDASTRLTDRASWDATVRALWDGATHREQWYAAIALARARFAARWQDLDTILRYEHLIRMGAWWDVVDEIAAHLVGPIVLADRGRGGALMRRWAGDDHLWIRRSAILHQLGFRSATDPDLLAATIDANLVDSTHGREFFIRKAIGWALRQYAYADADWVRSFVAARGDSLSPLSRREALKRAGAA